MSEEIGVLLFVVLLCVWQCMLGLGFCVKCCLCVDCVVYLPEEREL